MSKEKIIISVIALVFIVGFGILVWKAPQLTGGSGGMVRDITLLVRDDSHMTGQKGAKVTVVEFGDFQCPACAATEPTIQKIISDYKSNPDFNFVFRNFPLSQHQNAPAAAEAAEASGAQGKYWEMHSLLYAKQNEWGESNDPLPFFTTYAQTLGLDANKFKQDVTNNAGKNLIDEDVTDANAIPIDHTPTIYINGEEIAQTDLSYNSLKAKIDGLLAK